MNDPEWIGAEEISVIHMYMVAVGELFDSDARGYRAVAHARTRRDAPKREMNRGNYLVNSAICESPPHLHETGPSLKGCSMLISAFLCLSMGSLLTFPCIVSQARESWRA